MYLLLFLEGYFTDGQYAFQGLSILAVSLVAGFMLLDKRECTAWPHIHIYRVSKQGFDATQHKAGGTVQETTAFLFFIQALLHNLVSLKRRKYIA